MLSSSHREQMSHQTPDLQASNSQLQENTVIKRILSGVSHISYVISVPTDQMKGLFLRVLFRFIDINNKSIYVMNWMTDVPSPGMGTLRDRSIMSFVKQSLWSSWFLDVLVHHDHKWNNDICSFMTHYDGMAVSVDIMLPIPMLHSDTFLATMIGWMSISHLVRTHHLNECHLFKSECHHSYAAKSEYIVFIWWLSILATSRIFSQRFKYIKQKVSATNGKYQFPNTECTVILTQHFRTSASQNFFMSLYLILSISDMIDWIMCKCQMWIIGLFLLL